MKMKKLPFHSTFIYIFIFFISLSLVGCSNKIYPDRSQFIGDGDYVPRVDLSNYKSVQERPKQNPDLATVMAISGGGSRASNFGIGIMMGLEKIVLENGHTALQEIDYLSTVSGGGFAGGAYINALYEHHYSRRDSFSILTCVNEDIRRCLKHSYMGTLVRANFNPTLWFSLIDDGDALEKAIDDQVLGRNQRQNKKLENNSIKLSDLFIAATDTERPVLFPMMFANSTVYDKMAIFPFCPDILESYQISGFTHRLKKVTNAKPYAMPLSVGIKASGSFPALISNTTMISDFHPKRRFLHLIDGAMTDNLGLTTALDILDQESTSKKVFFIVDADNAGNNYTFSKQERAQFSFSVYSRLSSSGIDAKRVLVEEELESSGSRRDFVPIFFSFNQLIRGNTAAPPKVIKNIKSEQRRMIDALQKDMDNISDVDMQILYDLLINIGTKYNITEDEQALLLLSGQKIVAMQRTLIKAVME